MINTKRLDEDIPRYADGVKCPCGGYAERVETTVEERQECEPNTSWECCARAFLCVTCKTRLVGMAEAPEMDLGD